MRSVRTSIIDVIVARIAVKVISQVDLPNENVVFSSMVTEDCWGSMPTPKEQLNTRLS